MSQSIHKGTQIKQFALILLIKKIENRKPYRKLIEERVAYRLVSNATLASQLEFQSIREDSEK